MMFRTSAIIRECTFVIFTIITILLAQVVMPLAAAEIGSIEIFDTTTALPNVAASPQVHSSQPLPSPPRPLQLVYPGDDDQLVINQTNMDIMRNWNLPIFIVAICGPLHSGKSFLANQIMLNRTDGFALGWTTEPKTRGLWMWSDPVMDETKSHLLVFLDTEGLFASNVTESYDSKIFAISSLLSSHLIYNTVKFIDQSSIDYIELLIRRSHLFNINAMAKNATQLEENEDVTIEVLVSKGNNNNSLPSSSYNIPSTFKRLTWIVQDFVQEMVPGETPTSWLHSILRSGSSRNSAQVSTTNLLSLFKHVDCFTMFIPDYRKENLARLDQRMESQDLLESYKSDLAAVRDHILLSSSSSSSSSENNNHQILMTGPVVAHYTTLLVDAANRGDFPNIPTAWESFLNQQGTVAIDKSLDYFDSQTSLKQQQPLAKSELRTLFAGLEKESISIFTQITNGLYNIQRRYTPVLHQKLSILKSTFEAQNELRIQSLCADASFDVKQTVRKWEQSIELPIPADKFNLAKKDALRSALKKYNDDTFKFASSSQSQSDHNDELVSFISGIFDALEIKNHRLIVVHVEKEIEKIVLLTSRRLSAKVGEPMTLYELDQFSNPIFEDAEFDFAASSSVLLKDFPTSSHIKKTFQSHLDLAYEKMVTSNANVVNVRVKNIAGALSQTMSDNIDDIKLPLSSKTIKERVSMIQKKMLNSFDQQTAIYFNVSSQCQKSRHAIIDLSSKDFDELIDRNNVKLDRITKEILPGLNLQITDSSVWFPSSSVDNAQKIVIEEIKRREEYADVDEELVNDLAERYLYKKNYAAQVYSRSLGFYASIFVSVSAAGLIVLFVWWQIYKRC